MFENKLVLEALRFAIVAHDGQHRKYSKEPYIVHPIAVAEILSEYTNDAEMISAALLHDTVEDTDVTLSDIVRKFGSPVANLVEGLTDVSKPEDGNRAARKAIDRKHTAEASNRVQIVKCADLIHNTSDIFEQDKNFAKVYLVEKLALLDVMNVKWNAIHIRAVKQATKALEELNKCS